MPIFRAVLLRDFLLYAAPVFRIFRGLLVKALSALFRALLFYQVYSSLRYIYFPLVLKWLPFSFLLVTLLHRLSLFNSFVVIYGLFTCLSVTFSYARVFSRSLLRCSNSLRSTPLRDTLFSISDWFPPKPSLEYLCQCTTLGQIIRTDKLEIFSRNCDALKNAIPQTNQTELRSLLKWVMSTVHSCQTLEELLHRWTSKLPRGILWLRNIRPGAGYNFLAVGETFLYSHLGTSGTRIRVHPGCRCMQTPTWMHAVAGRASRLSLGYWSRSLSESDKIALQSKRTV